MLNTLRPFLLPLVVALAVGGLWQGLDGHIGFGAEHTASVPSSTQNSGADSSDTQGHAEDSHAGGHVDPFSFILLQLVLIILFAMLGRWAAQKFHQPSVLGELLIGVVVGHVGVWLDRPLSILVMHMSEAAEIWRGVWISGLSVAEAARQTFSAAEMGPDGLGGQLVQIMSGPGANIHILLTVAIFIFSNLGVILLLFLVGLESSVDEMLRVGPKALNVGIIGIVAPFVLGLLVTLWLLPDDPMPAHLFVAATLRATSVGITARVFKDLNRLQTPEAKVILGAAVIDDVLGLIILAIVVGIVATGEVQLFDIGRIVLLSSVFLGMVMMFGDRFVRMTIPLASTLDRHNCKVLLPLFVCFFLSWLANQIELATIVGAFAAGLILDDKVFSQYSSEKSSLEELMKPLESIFAPIFFVLMGMQVNLASFLSVESLGLGLAFIVVAIIGKIVSGMAAGIGADRLSVGMGMIPRGEVGLIFASVGKGLGVIPDSVFSAIVMMVIVTTFIAPIGLKWSLSRKESATPRAMA